MPKKRVLLADDHADQRSLRDLLGVKLSEFPRAQFLKDSLISPIGAFQQIFRLDTTSTRGAFEFGLHGSGADDRDRPEKLRILETEASGAVAAHAEAIE